MISTPNPTIDRNKLFTASCLALLVTSLSFGIRAGLLDLQGRQFHLNASQLGTIAATAFWGFPLAIIIGGFIVDIIGMKKLLVSAFVFHLAGILMTIWAGGYWALFLFIISIVAAILDYIVFPGSSVGPIGMVLSLGLLLPNFSVSIRRLHDIDRTGWWILIAFTVIGIIGATAAAKATKPG